MVNEILNCKCDVKVDRFQSKGDVAKYRLVISKDHRKIIKVRKINADCVKSALNISHKIADSFFYLKKGGKSQLKEKWVLVETKGDKLMIGIQQLSRSLELFSDSVAPIYGRLVLTKVPNILESSENNSIDKLHRKFVLKGGNFRRGNKELIEKVVMIKSYFNLE
jgi:hypothetical protein